MSSGAVARVLELRGEREQLEAMLVTISEDIDGCVLEMLADGMTGQAVATACGWSAQRVSQLRKRATLAGWGGFRPGYSSVQSVQELAVEFRVARHAQELRAEVATGGYATELDGFYGRGDRPAYDEGEAPLVWRDWLAHRSAALV